ncbi:MAG TPA: hypothetical protein PKG77_03420 [Phycisphaerae bacterium]|nr:hypothetical protein [Phycisphaerae bacterium]HQL72755.1 hypothetical protein [Phycisphaerae bacterium]
MRTIEILVATIACGAAAALLASCQDGGAPAPADRSREPTSTALEGTYEIIAVVGTVENLPTRRQKARVAFDVICCPFEVREPLGVVFYPDNGQTRGGHFPILSELAPGDTCRLTYRSHDLVNVERVLRRSPARDLFQMDGERVVFVHGQRLHPDAMSRPNDKDIAYARALNPAIVRKALTYAGRIRPGDGATLSAARRIGDYILLCVVPRGVDDGDIHLVYSIGKGEIIGRFSWYYQG